MDMPPFTCTGQEEVMDVFLIDPRGYYFNVVRMSDCDANWTCEFYNGYMGMGPGWSWYERGDPSTYPPGYMTPIPEPEEPVDPETEDPDPEDPAVDPEPEEPVQSGS